MKISIAIVPALLACTFASAALAQDMTVAARADAEASTRPAQSSEEAANQERIADRHCLRATGSRIVVMRNAKADRAQRRCAISPGRVHTSEDLERTGASSLGEALRRLEPSSR